MAGSKLARAHARNATHTFAPGDRVLDSATGLEAIVTQSRVAHRLGKPAAVMPGQASAAGLNLPVSAVHETVHVQLSDGSLATRDVGQLVPIPAGADLTNYGG